jgi:hypothetical protein
MSPTKERNQRIAKQTKETAQERRDPWGFAALMPIPACLVNDPGRLFGRPTVVLVPESRSGCFPAEPYPRSGRQ